MVIKIDNDPGLMILYEGEEEKGLIFYFRVSWFLVFFLAICHERFKFPE